MANEIISSPAEQIFQIVEDSDLIDGRYQNPTRLIARPGEGTFSIMFTALDTITGKKVVLKMFNTLTTRPDADYRKASFEREATLLLSLKGQPNIIQIVEGIQPYNVPLEHPGTGNTINVPLPYLVLELADSDLTTLILKETHDSIQILTTFKEICKGVQCLHSKKIFHRDLKPGNCLCFDRSDTKLSDLGTARCLDDPPLSQKYGGPVGDFSYQSPELICSLGEISQPLYYLGDFFALGAILFEMFTKSRLTGYVYDYQRMLDLCSIFANINDNQRLDEFNSLVPSIASRSQLPNISSFPVDIEPSILPRVDLLYRRLAAIDYRQRLTDFNTLFRDIEICLTILRNQRAYDKWLEKRRMFRERRLAKELKRLSGGTCDG